MDNKELRSLPIQHRTATVDGYDPEKRTVTFALSSEEPVARWYGNEILDHSDSSIDANVGSNIEVSTLPSGVMVANVSLATGERVKRDGQWHDHTEWHALVLYGSQADVVAKYVDKGSRIHVADRLRTQSWEDKKTGVKRYKTEIVVQDLTLLGDSSVTRAAHDDYSHGEPGEHYAGGY